MSLILGIDAGGTHTDSVIYNTNSRKIICKSKAFTTRSDLSVGIAKALERLSFDSLCEISRVHLSTTLTTNSLLEKKLSRVGVFLLGENILASLPCQRKQVLYRIPADPDWDHLIDEKKLQTEFLAGIDDVVISHHRGDTGLEVSLREHLKHLTSLPIRCASEKISSDEYYQRTLYSVVNTGLIPIITNLLSSLNEVLGRHQIQAPVYLLSNNGSLITADLARREPLRTLMSGPAASVNGALHLTDQQDFLLIDMGGTSADVTKIVSRTPRMRSGPAVIDDLPLPIQSLDIQSFAIGGDSHIHYNQLGRIVAGPGRVIPLCVAGHFWPHLQEELAYYRKPENYELFSASETDCYMVGRRRLYSSLTSFERKVADFLREQPHSLFCISEHFHTDPDSLHLKKLVEQEYLQRISFTPTDLLHITGKYVTWNQEISRLAAQRLALAGKMSLEEFLSTCEKCVDNDLVFSCMQSVANFEEQQFDFRSNPATYYTINSFLQDSSSFFGIRFCIRTPVVAVGAPSGSWMPDVARKLATRLILPEHFEVATAVGAAVSSEGSTFQVKLWNTY